MEKITIDGGYKLEMMGRGVDSIGNGGGGGGLLVRAMQLSNLLKQLFRLLGSELDVANVVDTVAVLLDVVVAHFRLHRVRTQQRVRHE